MDGVISAVGMEKAAEDLVEGLWKNVGPAVVVTDYISEMTDQFVIYQVFRDDPLQERLLSHFARG